MLKNIDNLYLFNTKISAPNFSKKFSDFIKRFPTLPTSIFNIKKNFSLFHFSTKAFFNIFEKKFFSLCTSDIYSKNNC